jgi:hypothetical protein
MDDRKWDRPCDHDRVAGLLRLHDTAIWGPECSVMADVWLPVPVSLVTSPAGVICPVDADPATCRQRVLKTRMALVVALPAASTLVAL